MEKAFVYVEIASEKEISEAFKIYKSNEEYFQIVSNKKPELQDVLDDKNALPGGIDPAKKRYGIYKMGENNVAVVDILEGYPDEDAVYVGLFMIDGKQHRSGHGRALMQEIEQEYRDKGYRRMRLGVVEGNERAMKFWTSLGFTEVKKVVSTVKPETNWIVHVMEKQLGIGKDSNTMEQL